MPQVNLLINKNTYQIITEIAKQTGTTRKNIMSIAFAEILDEGITKEHMEEITQNHHLDYRTSMNLSETFYEKMIEWGKFGLSERKFLGYLICDFFSRKKDYFFNDNYPEEDEEDIVVVFLSDTRKKQLISLSRSLSISLSGLFSYYVLNKNVGNFVINQIDNPSRVRMTIKSHVKQRLVSIAEGRNLTVDYYLKQITEQIIHDYQK